MALLEARSHQLPPGARIRAYGDPGGLRLEGTIDAICRAVAGVWPWGRGAIHLPAIYYKPLVGILLWVAAARLLWQPKDLAYREVRPPPLWITLPAGAVLGLLAGLTGTGGGIFLSPLVILMAWEEPRHTSGVVAAFIFLNSAAGLAGNIASVGHLPHELPLFLLSVAAGAVLGTWLGVERLPRAWLLRTLGVVLTVAGTKLLFT